MDKSFILKGGVIISIIDITSKCNLSCVYCCRDNASKEVKEPELDELLDVIKQVNRMRGTFIVLQGGEPLCRKDCVDVFKGMGKLKEVIPGYYLSEVRRILREKHIASIFEKNYIRLLIEQHLPLYCLTTNGMKYSEEIEDALYQSGFSVEVSLDSVHEDVNKMTRVGINFPRVVENIKKYSKRLPTEISCTITERNVEELPEMIPFAANLGCICVKYSPVIMIGKRKEDGKMWEKRYLESIEKAIKVHENYKEALFLKIKFLPHMLNTEKGMEVYEKAEKASNILIELHKCNAFIQIKNAYIDSDLNVYGCASMKNRKELMIGNLREQTLKEIWNSEQRLRQQKLIEKYNYESEHSGSCSAVAYSQEN